MDVERDDIISKDINIDRYIYEILNNAYHEFSSMYGNKHSKHIKGIIEAITDKIEEITEEQGNVKAGTKHDGGIFYTKIDETLPAILKHELWHAFNMDHELESSQLSFLNEKYRAILAQSNSFKKFYNDTMNQYKEKFKDDSKRLELILKDFETFLKNYSIGACEIEKWNEWLNCQTHANDMWDNFTDWQEGFITYSYSSGSFYDIYTNINDMIGCLIPREKLIDMYLNTSEYPTGYSYLEMQNEFDEKYLGALTEEEKREYGYPYLKILLGTRDIENNYDTNPKKAREILQSCMKTCFNAYVIKLDSLKDIDSNVVKELFEEIKYMQDHMLWNVDVSKMQGLDYVQAMEQIQQKFKEKVSALGIDNPEIQDMLDKIDYKNDNRFDLINGAEGLTEVMSRGNDKKGKLIELGGYKVNVGEGGIKESLYNSLFTLLKEKKFNLLFKETEENTLDENEENILLRIYNQINNATTNEEYNEIYNEIYELQYKEMEEAFKNNGDIEYLLSKYADKIIGFQIDAPFDEESKRYLPQMERIISLYNLKAKEFIRINKEKIKVDTEQFLKKGYTREQANHAGSYIHNYTINKINMKIQSIETQRDNQALAYRELIQKGDGTQGDDAENSAPSFTISQIGKATINAPIQNKRKVAGVEQTEMNKEDKMKQ